MHLQLMNKAICRTPLFSPGETLEKCLPVLKEIIRESSPDFHRVIENLDHRQIITGNDKIAFSVWKYFNRAKYRATPFGSFAAISYVPWDVSGAPLTLEAELIKHSFTDWSETHLYKDEGSPEWFLANATCYRVGDEVRYVKFTGSQFELASVPAIPELDTLLTLCRDKYTRIQVHQAMGQAFNTSPSIIDDLIAQMLDHQLLFSELSSNITGADYFKRLGIHDQKKTYIIAERKYYSGGPDPLPMDLLPEYVNFIRNFLPTAPNEDLSRFKRSFSRRFDRQAVPLSLAIDPETGVGYGGLETATGEQDLAGILNEQVQAVNHMPDNTRFSAYPFLLNSIMQGGAVRLEEFKDQITANALAISNTFNTIFSYWKGVPVIQSSGGCTANALLGRFTLTGGQSYETAKQIAAIEEQANPDILFFDVAYQAEKDVDNVNRRQQLYENELPLLTWSCHGHPLSLDDLLVMVRQDEIILWSKKYHKRVVPRIASAYNYTRSDLALYRFFCDLQHQGLASQFTFSLRQIIPGLDHYPCVFYKNMIVSPAMWKVNLPKTDIAALKQWLNKNQISAHFKCGHADQTLCFDPHSDEDLHSFLMYYRQQKDPELYITEALLGDPVTDPEGKEYIPQYVATFFHTEQIYRRYDPPVSRAGNDIFYPGSEWLYMEIYCHPLRSNQVLQIIRKFTVKHKKLLKKWFFVRYTDPAPHLRLRLHLKNIQNIGLMLGDLRAVLASLCNAGLISDLQVKTYDRESERYGEERMPAVETHFYYDSIYITALLARKRSNEELYIITLKLMYYWLRLAGMDDNQLFIKTIADNFSEEFHTDKETYKQINKSYELIKKSLNDSSLVLSKAYEGGFIKIIKDAKTEIEKENLVADLIHMHVNRVFFTNQRKHEAILYQYLQKWLKSLLSREADGLEQ